MSDFKKLLVWEKAHSLALRARKAAMGIRQAHDLSLRSQIIRAAMSVPANIVEGRRQSSEKDFARFLGIALNSGFELEYHLIVAGDIGAIPKSECESLLRETVEVRKMLFGLQRKLNSTKVVSHEATALS
jgi:four helix bundle protein